MAGVEAMQPLRELVAVQRMAHGPFHLRELVGGEQRAQLLVQLDDPLLRFLVLRREANQAADVGERPCLTVTALATSRSMRVCRVARFLPVSVLPMSFSRA